LFIKYFIPWQSYLSQTIMAGPPQILYWVTRKSISFGGK